MSVEVPDSSSPVDELVSTWRAAHARYATVVSYWRRVRLVMWPAAVVAIVVLLTNSRNLAAALASVLSLIGFAAAFVCVGKLLRASSAEGRAWAALREHTGLSDAELGRVLADN